MYRLQAVGMCFIVLMTARGFWLIKDGNGLDLVIFQTGTSCQQVYIPSKELEPPIQDERSTANLPKFPVCHLHSD